MNSKYIPLLIFSFFVFNSVTSQTATEAYRLSLSDPLGTARNLGAGNSMFAIGPDFSAIGSNPAGIAGFWKSEFTVTGSILFNSYSSYFSTDRNRQSSGNYNPFSLPNIGFIITSRPRNSAWKTSNWAIGMNRTSEYKQEIQYEGYTLGSITDSWRENAAGTEPNDLNGFEEGLAYTSGAIYDFEEDNLYETDYNLTPEYLLYKNEYTHHEGGKSELFIGYGANLDNKLMFGAELNMPFVNFTEYHTYWEADGSDDGVPFFNDLEYYRFVNTTGYGINGKFGITLKPAKSVNLSFAAHTPVKLFLTDNYNTSLSYDYTDDENNGPIRSDSPYGSFNYAMSTPWILHAGLGIIAGTSGFIAASIKWTDYSKMKYDYSVNGNGNYYAQIEREVNQDIQEQYSSTLDIQVGGEMVIRTFRIRGGASFTQSPYINDTSLDPAYHAGIGYRADDYYVDLAYRWLNQDTGYLPYETIQAPQPLVITETNRNTISMTLGFKF